MGLVDDQKKERRARILEVAREQIEEHGYDGVTMRDLADACGLSVPTLYNLCGPKDELLFQAVASEFDENLDRLERGPRLRGHKRVLALLALGYEEMERRPAYYRTLLSVVVRSEAARAPLFAIGARLYFELRAAFEEMLADGDLEAWVDIDALAQRLASTCVSVSFEWAGGYVSTEGARAITLYGAGLQLLGVTRGGVRTAIEKVVRREQKAVIAGQVVHPAEDARRA